MCLRLVLLSFLGVTAGCLSAEQWGLPREPLSVTAPDRGKTAFVRNHPNIDPPDQSIGLRDAEGSEREFLTVTGATPQSGRPTV